jgi:hypothetical protein
MLLAAQHNTAQHVNLVTDVASTWAAENVENQNETVGIVICSDLKL